MSELWKPPEALTPLSRPVGPALPRFLRDELKAYGVREEDWHHPIHVRAVLGQCSAVDYPKCPNLPSHHARMLKYAPKYTWFDMDLKSGDGSTKSLRLVANEGDTDCNDGFWGCYWELANQSKLADVIAFGDCGTRIRVCSDDTESTYKDHGKWLPEEFPDIDYVTFNPFEYGSGSELEKVLGLGLRLALVLVHERICKEYAFPNESA